MCTNQNIRTRESANLLRDAGPGVESFKQLARPSPGGKDAVVVPILFAATFRRLEFAEQRRDRSLQFPEQAAVGAPGTVSAHSVSVGYEEEIRVPALRLFHL